MLQVALDVRNSAPRIALIPGPVELLGCAPQLDDEVTRKILGPDLTSFFLPEPNQGIFIVPHDDPCIGPPDEGTATLIGLCPDADSHLLSPWPNMMMIPPPDLLHHTM